MNNINSVRSAREQTYNYYARKPLPEDERAQLQHQLNKHTAFARVCELSPREAHDRFVMKNIKMEMQDGDYSNIKTLYENYKKGLTELRKSFRNKSMQSANCASEIEKLTHPPLVRNDSINQLRAAYIIKTLGECNLDPIELKEFQEMAEEIEMEGMPPSPTSPLSASSTSSSELMSPRSPPSASLSDSSESEMKSNAPTGHKVFKQRPPFVFPNK